MTVQAVTTLTEPGRNFRGTFKLGDIALRLAAGFTLLFLFLPILVIKLGFAAGLNSTS